LKDEHVLLATFLDSHPASWNHLQSDRNTAIARVEQAVKQIQEAAATKGEELCKMINEEFNEQVQVLQWSNQDATSLKSKNEEEQAAIDQLLTTPPETFPALYQEWSSGESHNRDLVGHVSDPVPRLSINLDDVTEKAVNTIASCSDCTAATPKRIRIQPLLLMLKVDLTRYVSEI
jgi:hypothetical protein